MNKIQILYTFGIFLCFVLTLSHTGAATSSYSDYNEIRNLYEFLVEKESRSGEDSPMSHRMMRKNNRSPSLRLRFGRRSDPYMNQAENSKYEEPFRNIPNISTNED